MSRRESGRQSGGKDFDQGNDLEQGPDPEGQDGGAYMYGEMAGEEEEEADNTMLIVGIIVCVVIVLVLAGGGAYYYCYCCDKGSTEKTAALKACDTDLKKDTHAACKTALATFLDKDKCDEPTAKPIRENCDGKMSEGELGEEAKLTAVKKACADSINKCKAKE